MLSESLCKLIHDAGIDVNLNELRNAAFRDAAKDFEPIELAQIVGLNSEVAFFWNQRGLGLSTRQKEYVNRRCRAYAAGQSTKPNRPPDDNHRRRRTKASDDAYR
jgi:hypothetical protein